MSDLQVYESRAPTWVSSYLWEIVISRLQEHVAVGDRVFEVGCGNGAFARRLNELGYFVTGVDVSESGIGVANDSTPGLDLRVGSAYDNLAERYGQYPCVVCLEVVEHCYYPTRVASTIYDLLEEGGVGILSTPYHGYIKNLALAVTGKFDQHFTPLWDGGHIKFFSKKTLKELLDQAGFGDVSISTVGRIPPLAKSMVAVFRKS